MDTKLISFDEATILFKRCLCIIGVLPNNLSGRRLLFTFFFSSSLIHWSMFVVHSIVEQSTSVETIYETMATIGVNARFYILLWKRREFTRLMDDCGELWNECDARTQPLVINFERKMRKLFWFIFGSIFVVDILYSSSAIYVNHVAEKTNGTKILPYRWYGVQDVDSWPGYRFVFSVQVLVIYNAGIISATVDSALPLLMILCCGYLQVLRQRLDDIENSSDSDMADRQLVDCCKFHQGILNLCSRVEQCGRIMFLVELGTSGYVLSLVAIKLASSDPQKYKYIPILCLLLGHILICQWAPDHLMDESEEVSTAVYSTACAFMARPSSRYVTLMIQRAQKPMIMTAGGIVILSMENFGRMLTSAVSFFTAMRNFA